MPIYEYECERCGRYFDGFAPMSEYRDPKACECGGIGHRIISTPKHVMPDFEAFVDNTGTYIGGRSSYREHLKKIGGVELGNSDIEYMKAEKEKKNAKKWKDPERKKIIIEEFNKRRLT